MQQTATDAEVAKLYLQINSLNATIDSLKEKYSDLAEMVSELSGKYASLLREHEALSKRVSVNIDTNNGSVIGFAAEPRT